MARKLVVEIIGDASSLEKAYAKAGNQSKGFGSSLARVGKIAAFTAGGAALGGLAVAIKRGADEFSDSQKQMAQTVAGLKSTGGAAKVTSKHITDLASSVSRYSAIDDEAVQASENMLLTFTKIRNEQGKGNKIFDKATVAVADLATRMNNGAIPSAEKLAKTSILVGKALNDPIKGIGALRRVGVAFTDQQKKQIEAMVKAGDTMGAQKVILHELTSEFGGSAKAAGSTFSGSLNKLKNSFDEVAGSVIQGLAPGLQKLADKTNAWLSKAENQKKLQDTINGIMKTAGEIIRGVTDFIRKAAPVVQNIVDKLGGWKHVLELLVAIKFASWIAGANGPLSKLATNAQNAARFTKLLFGNLKNIAALGPIAIALTLFLNRDAIDKWVTGFLNKHGLGAFTGDQVTTWDQWVKVPADIKRKIIKNTKGFDPTMLPGAPKAAGGRNTSGGRGSSVGMSFAPSVVPMNAANTGAVVFNAPVNVHGVQDPQQFIKWAQRQARVTSPSRSGPFGGHNVGLT